MGDYKHKEYSISIPISYNSIAYKYKPYGFYVKNGIKRVRNYRHHLKNGKGLSLTDIFAWQIKETKKRLNIEMCNAFI